MTPWSTGLHVPFRGQTSRDGLLIHGTAGWGEFSPFWDYDDEASVPWLVAAQEASGQGWPEPVRATVPVNSIVPAVGPDQAARLALAGGCTTVKIKVGQWVTDPQFRGIYSPQAEAPGSLEPLDAEVARVAAVRAALDATYGKGGGRIRVDVNGAWTVSEAAEHLKELDAVAGGLEYAEQPCATVDELAELRRLLSRAGVDLPIAADESIRRASDPLRVAAREAADIAVLKVAPLGGVRACLDLAEQIGMPVVVSSALESSIGLAAGVALAAALPELPYACGLGTGSLLVDDVVAEPLLAVDGHLPVLRSDDPRLTPVRFSSDESLAERWNARIARVGAR